MLRGATLAGGEIGHTVIDRNGPLCTCGKHGCVEAFASLGAVTRRVRPKTEALALVIIPDSRSGRRIL